jgi:hypothetical protein
VDATTGARRAMRTTTGYTFRSARGITERRFRIEVSTGAVSPLQLANVRLERVGSGYHVTYSMTKDADVAARLISPSGKVITSLPVTRSRAGLNSMIFEARDSLGRVSARGVYLLELTAQSVEGEQVKALKSVPVR